MTLAGDYLSDYMRGRRNGVASILAAIGRDPTTALDPQPTDVVLHLAEFEHLVKRAERAEAALTNARAEVKQLHTAILLADADVHRMVTIALAHVLTHEEAEAVRTITLHNNPKLERFSPADIA